MPKPASVVCLSIDRLHAGMLGAYGNAWVHSPSFDALAAESFVFDQAYADSLQLERLLDGMWLGKSAFGRCTAARPPLAALAGGAGIDSLLVTDDVAVAERGHAAGFGQVQLIATEPNERVAHGVDQTHLARFFAAATECIETGAPRLLWLHTRGLVVTWDAPLELRNQYVEEDDPPPPTTSIVPELVLAAEHDPDELLGLVRAYAGQVALLDDCLGALADEVATKSGDSLLVLMGTRGFPLGEHLRVGVSNERLYNESLQLPWLVRFPQRMDLAGRSQALVQTADLYGTLAAWWELADEGMPNLLSIVDGRIDAIRDYAVVESATELAIRTPAWFVRRPRGSGQVELYAKPSDRWEVNDVAGRCAEIVGELEGVLAAAESLPPHDLPDRLPNVLLEIVD